MSSMYDRGSNLNSDIFVKSNSPETGHRMFNADSTFSQAFDVSYRSPRARSLQPLKRNNFHINNDELSPKSPLRIVKIPDKTNGVSKFIEQMLQLEKEKEKIVAEKKLRKIKTCSNVINQSEFTLNDSIDDQLVSIDLDDKSTNNKSFGNKSGLSRYKSMQPTPNSSLKRKKIVDTNLIGNKLYKSSTSSSSSGDSIERGFKKKLEEIKLINPNLKPTVSNISSGSSSSEIGFPDSVDDGSLEEELKNVILINPNLKKNYNHCPSPVESQIESEFALNDSIDDQLVSIDLDDKSTNNKSFGNKSGLSRYKSMPSTPSSSSLKRKNNVDSNLIGNKLYKSSTSSSDDSIERDFKKKLEETKLINPNLKPTVSNISAEFALPDSSDDDLLSIDLDFLVKSSQKYGFSRHKSMPVKVSTTVSSMSSSSLEQKDNAVGGSDSPNSIKSNNQQSSSSSSSYTMTEEERKKVARKRENALAKLRASRQKKIKK